LFTRRGSRRAYDEAEDAADAVLVARIPVLHGRILDARIVASDKSTTAACSWFSSRIGAVQPSGNALAPSSATQCALEPTGVGR
jgi:hypothetical protein